MSIINSPSVQLGFENEVDANRGLIGMNNLVTINNISATSEGETKLARNLANPATYLKWQSLILTEQYLTVALDGGDLVDYVGIAGHNFGSGNVPVSVEGYVSFDTNGNPDWVEIFPDIIPPNDGALLLRFVPDYYVGIRIRLQTALVVPFCSVVHVGKLLVLQRNIYVGHTPVVFGRETRVINGRSESGEFLGRVVLAEALTSSIALRNITPSWYRSHLDPFISDGKEYPFFWAWRPYSYPMESAYGWITNDPRPTNELPNGMMAVTIDIGAVA